MIKTNKWFFAGAKFSCKNLTNFVCTTLLYMENSIDFRLVFSLINGKISTLFRKKISEDFKEAHLEITSEQWDVLLAISMTDTCTQQQLGEATSFSKTTISRLLDGLEEKGLIQRDKSRVDWRANYIRITRKGQVVYNQTRLVAEQALKDILRGLTRNEIAIAQKSLSTIISNMKLLSMNKKREADEADLLLKKRRERLISKLILHKQS